MEKTIYIKLLDEGTVSYRPVPAIEYKKNVYEVMGTDIYSADDEVWEFKPGEHVIVEEQVLSGGVVLVAIKKEI